MGNKSRTNKQDTITIPLRRITGKWEPANIPVIDRFSVYGEEMAVHDALGMDGMYSATHVETGYRMAVALTPLDAKRQATRVIRKAGRDVFMRKIAEAKKEIAERETART
jgi:hypothetical protein